MHAADASAHEPQLEQFSLLTVSSSARRLLSPGPKAGAFFLRSRAPWAPRGDRAYDRSGSDSVPGVRFPGPCRRNVRMTRKRTQGRAIESTHARPARPRASPSRSTRSTSPARLTLGVAPARRTRGNAARARRGGGHDLLDYRMRRESIRLPARKEIREIA